MVTLLHGPQGLSHAAELWKADVLQSLGTGDHDRAVRATGELCDSAEFLRQEPFFVSQLVRARIGRYAVDALQLLLARDDLTPEQFQAIDRRLAEMESAYRLAGTVRAERAAFFTSMENLDRWGTLAYRPELMRQQAWALEKMTELAERIDVFGPEGQRRWSKTDNEITAAVKSMGRDTPVGAMFPAVGLVRDTGLEYRQRLVAARLALRVDRYRAENGELPGRLEDVLDDALPEVPAGLLSGRPPEYEAARGGFTIREVLATEDEERADMVEVDYSPK
jgi:hypothetical protein